MKTKNFPNVDEVFTDVFPVCLRTVSSLNAVVSIWGTAEKIPETFCVLNDFKYSMHNPRDHHYAERAWSVRMSQILPQNEEKVSELT